MLRRARAAVRLPTDGRPGGAGDGRATAPRRLSRAVCGPERSPGGQCAAEFLSLVSDAYLEPSLWIYKSYTVTLGPILFSRAARMLRAWNQSARAYGIETAALPRGKAHGGTVHRDGRATLILQAPLRACPRFAHLPTPLTLRAAVPGATRCVGVSGGREQNPRGRAQKTAQSSGAPSFLYTMYKSMSFSTCARTHTASDAGSARGTSEWRW